MMHIPAIPMKQRNNRRCLMVRFFLDERRLRSVKSILPPYTVKPLQEFLEGLYVQAHVWDLVIRQKAVQDGVTRMRVDWCRKIQELKKSTIQGYEWQYVKSWLVFIENLKEVRSEFLRNPSQTKPAPKLRWNSSTDYSRTRKRHSRNYKLTTTFWLDYSYQTNRHSIDHVQTFFFTLVSRFPQFPTLFYHPCR